MQETGLAHLQLTEEHRTELTEQTLLSIQRVLSAEHLRRDITGLDVNHSVSGKISRTGDLVQVDGDLVLMKSGYCKMNIITEDADIIIGDVVETSGIGGVYPKGIKIGTITELKQNDEGTGNYAVIKPEVDFSRIDEVIILSSEDEESGK